MNSRGADVWATPVGTSAEAAGRGGARPLAARALDEHGAGRGVAGRGRAAARRACHRTVGDRHDGGWRRRRLGPPAWRGRGGQQRDRPRRCGWWGVYLWLQRRRRWRGAGATGGGGGAGDAGGGIGGAGGASAGSAGAAGFDSFTDSGAGGGGGGAHGFVGAALPGVAASGGAGGKGGSTQYYDDSSQGGGGGGGAGGYGAVVTGTGSLGTLGSAVTGGRGGDGGYAAVIGNDGTGGFGLLFTNAAGATFTVNAAVQGGAGGVGDPWRGPGAGGAGIVGQNLSIIMGVAGSVAGAPDANAIVFTGGANKLTFTKATTGLTGNIGVTGSLTFDQSGIDTTVGNVITGGGSVVKTGTHTITLSGANSYTGGTTVNTGTLALTGSGTLGATTNAVTLNGATAVLGLGGTTQTQDGGVVLQGGGTIQNGTLASAGTFALQSGTVSAALAGMGGVSKTTGGTVILSGNNTYAGGTAINGGTLAVSADANLGNGAGALGFGGGTLQFNGSFATNRAITLNVGGGTFDTNGNAAALSGSIGGTDGLTKTGTGTLIFSGNNSYSGATSVNAGALRAGAVNTFASGSAFTVASGAALDLNNFGQTIGSLAGGGTVTLGSAALTAGGDNTSTTFAGGLGGTGGSLVKTGTGTLLLTATSLYSGATTVSAGTLVVNGDIASSSGITVNAGARLAGTGTVGATLINSGGMFGPGSGTPGSSMTVAGNLAFQSGALYLVQVDPSNASRANVTAGGSATLAGTAVAAFAPGSYVTRSYTILSATGGLGGSTFDALTTSNLPVGFTARLGYTNSDVILNLTARLAPAGVSGSQPNIAVTLNDFFNGGGALPPAFLPVFGLTGGSLGNALSQLSGEAATGARQSAFQFGGQFLNLMLDPFVDGRGGAGGPAIGFATARAPLPDEIALAFAKAMKVPVTEAPPPGFAQRWSAWGGGFGGASRSSGDPASGSHDLSARTAGFAAGLDYRLTPDTVAGFTLAGGGTNWSLAQGLGGGKSDAFQAGVYGTMRAGPAYLATAFAFAQHWMSTDRIAFAGDHLTAAFNAQSFGGRIEGGYRTTTMLGGFTPYAALQAQSFRTPSYRETDLTGGGFALAYDARTGTAARSELGARSDHAVALDPTALLTLRARLAWAHDWVSDPSLVAGFQTLPGTSFIVNGAVPAKDSALASASAELRFANGIALLGKLDGEFAARATSYAGTATVRYAW